MALEWQIRSFGVLVVVNPDQNEMIAIKMTSVNKKRRIGTSAVRLFHNLTYCRQNSIWPRTSPAG